MLKLILVTVFKLKIISISSVFFICRCINTFTKAHDGFEACSVVFSRNGKYLLSAGKNSICKLWELSTSRCLIAYTGAGKAFCSIVCV